MAVIFFSYCHRDEALRDQLETHLSMMKRQGFIETWHDRRITAGTSLDEAISAKLEEADIVLLLVSPDFLNSDYCYDVEMQRAIERHKQGACTVIPVILRPCDWHDAPFGGLLATPDDGKPITQWPDRDSAFLNVTTAIKKVLRTRGSTRAAPTVSARFSPTVRDTPEPQGAVRSSNLRITKSFTQHDKEAFLQDCFDFIAKYFENSLQELARRNASIEVRFRKIDANRFTAVAYRDGEAVSRCSIVLGGGFGSGICFSYDDAASTSSFNESMSVDCDDQSLFLKPLGMSSLRGRAPESDKLSPEGGAEFYWDLFIEPLQRR